jgi:glycosyltransferase involved in cell wall biosynthesis
MQGKLKSVVHVIDELTPGGAEKILVMAVNGLAEKDLKVTVVTLIRPGNLAGLLNEKVNNVCLYRKSHWNLKTLRKFNDILKSHEVVHVHLKHTLKYVFLSWLIRPFDSRVLLHDHSGDVLITKGNVYPSFMRWWVSGIYYLGVTTELTAWASRLYLINRARAFTLHNVVESDLIRLPVERRNHDTVLKLVLVANFRPIKNIEFAINLVSYLHSIRHMRVHLTVFGQTIDQECYLRVKKQIDNLNLETLVSLVLDESTIVPRLKEFDMGLHCSFAETGPLSLLEFMQAGLPFLAIKRGHVAEEISNYRAELIINNFDLENWADRIEVLFPFPEHLSNDLQQYVNDRYESGLYIKQLCEIYSSIVED